MSTQPDPRIIKRSSTPWRYAFTALVAALEPARLRLSRGDANALVSIRRIAHEVRDTAATCDLEQVVALAEELQHASDAQPASDLVDKLLRAIRDSKLVGEERAFVLIIEDDRLTMNVMADVIRAGDLEVLTAGSAVEARSIIYERDVALVLLDLILPDADGRDLLRELRSRPATQSVPIVVMTAKQDVMTHSECFALGADAFLTKPVHPDVLKSAISSQLLRARQMQRERRTDPLTQLPNRTAFFEALERAASHARRKNQALCVAMIDLDHFKSVNDRHGHSTGDEVLRRAARVISATLRTSDLVARWGGEEFCAFLPGTDLQGGVIALQKALSALSAERFLGSDDTEFAITFSAGVTLCTGHHQMEPALADADRLLYMAKASGRNRVLSPLDDAEPPKPCVLVADDDKAVTKTIRRILERAGYEVVACSDGASALEAVHSRQHVALAVLDVNMPKMSGFDLLAQLRTHPASAKIPVLMLTAADSEDDVVRGFELGVSDYMVKPFYNAELVARVNRLMNRR